MLVMTAILLVLKAMKLSSGLVATTTCGIPGLSVCA